MTVTHRLHDRPAIQSEFCIEDNSLTRVIDSNIQTIYLKDRTSLEDLNRLSSLDDETFSLMAGLQKNRRTV